LMKNAYNYPYCRLWRDYMLHHHFSAYKKLAQMLNKPKNKEYGFRCQTWQTRCKRNKAAVDKAFMPHSGKQP
ncbi:TPA: hypothetical protein ACGICR_002611, partial [Salmonella enterica subsp. enterica serovar Typhimurium]